MGSLDAPGPWSRRSRSAVASWPVMQEGWLNETLLAQETQREQAIDSGKRVLVGINRFADQELGGPMPTADDDDQSFVLARVKAFTTFRDDRTGFDLSTERSTPPSADSLRALAGSDKSTEATLSELATLYWPGSEVQFGHRFLPIAVADGARFEDLREAALDSEPRPRALLVRFDTDQKLRASLRPWGGLDDDGRHRRGRDRGVRGRESDHANGRRRPSRPRPTGGRPSRTRADLRCTREGPPRATGAPPRSRPGPRGPRTAHRRAAPGGREPGRGPGIGPPSTRGRPRRRRRLRVTAARFGRSGQRVRNASTRRSGSDPRSRNRP